MRIAIVNHAPATAEALRQIIVGAPGDRVAWVATDGAEAVEQCSKDTPHLILMDLMMPTMDGAEATRRIMTETPCPILIVTATVEERFAKVFEALHAGALDAVQTPTLFGNRTQQGVAALRLKIEAIRRQVSGESAPERLGAYEKPPVGSIPCKHLVAIGASAGGPAALAAILSRLPSDFPAAIVIVQHLDARFAPSMATWLNGQSRVPVRIAEHRRPPQANIALLAGTSDHLVFTGPNTLSYTENPPDHHPRPSVDLFFESIIGHWRGPVAGVLLSGMGRDGARGLKTLRDAGFLTIAQDSATCAVYGMPMAAVELGAAVEILPVEQIAQHLVAFVGVHKRTQL